MSIYCFLVISDVTWVTAHLIFIL